MNVVSFLHVDEKRAGKEQSPESFNSPVARRDIEVKIPLDIHDLLQRITEAVRPKEEVEPSEPHHDKSPPAAEQVRAEQERMLSDVKRVSYREGWVDGRKNLRKTVVENRRKIILNLRNQYVKREQESQNKIMRLSLLYNSKNLQIAELEQECSKYQLLIRTLHKEKETLKEALHGVRQDRDRIAEFLEASKMRETRLSWYLARTTTELAAYKQRKWWEFWKW
jgi:hypothetical protein